MEYYTRAHQAGFYSFADILYVDYTPWLSFLWFSLAVPSEDDLRRCHPLTARTRIKSSQHYVSALRWFAIEKNFQSYWEWLPQQLCAQTSRPANPSTRQ